MIKYGYIYGLIDPENNEIFYIGKTVNPKYRLSGHISPSNLKKKSNCIYRLNSIIKKGFKPKLLILAKCKFENINKFEKRYITKYRKLNKNLTNERDGGECWNITKKRITDKVLAADRRLMVPVILRNSATNEDLEFESLKSAAAYLNVSVPTLCAYLSKKKRGHRKCKGFFVRYKDEVFVEPVKFVSNFKIQKFDRDMNLIKTYNNRNELIADGYDDRYIYNATINKKRKTAHGFIWRRLYD